jgi:ribosomal protein L37E
MPMWLTLTIISLGLSGVLLAVGAALMIRDTCRRKGAMGLNFRKVDCPRCGMKAPAIRIPTSLHQAMWGGWTCSRCETEIDKWGREIEVDPDAG